MSTADDLQWMRQALTLAIQGQGSVEPNPMVGAVVLDANGQLVGEGFHAKFGGPHAEVAALAMAGEKARGGTLYVTLEPCCHHGKTPPCTDTVIAAGIKRVVAAMTDPFPKVAGGGVTTLRSAGIEVTLGVGLDEARLLADPYVKRVTTRKPWVHFKWAMSLDGKIATRTGDSKWISSEESRRIVHELRGRMDAIIVGAGTVRADDPLLTARPPGPRMATRIVLSASGHLPADCQLLRTAGETPVLIVTTAEGERNLGTWRRAGVELLVLSDPFIHPLLADLGHRGMTNVLVEGGAGVLGSFVGPPNEGDEVHVFVAPMILCGAGVPSVGGSGPEWISRALRLTSLTARPCGNDLYVRGRTTSVPRP
jgi:diaminohydroxyphosphoribosylaminopyrimidine deaminase/5-amino-6-(5-phosphoribosylamino)uracil reductase